MPEPDVIVPARIRERGQPDYIGEEPETFSQATMRAFWAWVETKYSPGEIEVIRDNPNVILQFYIKNVQGTQWDVGYERLPRGRPQPEKYGIDEDDWRVLELSQQRAEQELRTWMSTGKINQFQARDIWDELSQRTRQAQLDVLVPSQIETPEARAERRVEALRRTGEKGVAGLPAWWLEKYKDEPELGAFIERREARGEARGERRRESLAFRREEALGFGAEFAGVTGPQPWQDWFERQFPSIVSKFRTAFPFTQEAYEGLTFGEAQEKEEKLWPEYLTRKTAAKREEYATRFPFGPQGRPWTYQPRITTVGF